MQQQQFIVSGDLLAALPHAWYSHRPCVQTRHVHPCRHCCCCMQVWQLAVLGIAAVCADPCGCHTGNIQAGVVEVS
jgi:hypothetical protein